MERHCTDAGCSRARGSVTSAVTYTSYTDRAIGACRIQGLTNDPIGAAVDRWGPRPTAIAALVGAAVGVAGVVTARSTDPLAEIRLIGSTPLYGGGLAVLLLVRLATFAERFAGPRFGFLSGIFALAYPVGGSFIVWFGGLAYDHWRSYLPAFGISAGGLLLATLALLLVTRQPAANREVPRAYADASDEAAAA